MPYKTTLAILKVFNPPTNNGTRAESTESEWEEQSFLSEKSLFSHGSACTAENKRQAKRQVFQIDWISSREVYSHNGRQSLPFAVCTC